MRKRYDVERRPRAARPRTQRDEQLPLPLPGIWDRHAFVRRMVAERGVSKTFASTIADTLATLIKRNGLASPALLFPDLAVAEIDRADRRPRRRRIHLALKHYLALSNNEVPPEIVAEFRTLLASSFPGRRAADPRFVDVDLGGSKKRVRKQTPITLYDVEQMIDAAKHTAPAALRLRDIALLTLYGWSGLPPANVIRLRWEDVDAIVAAHDGETHRIPIQVRGRAHQIVIHQRAVEALNALRRASGMPTSGVVFRTASSARVLSGDHAYTLLRKYAAAAGLGPIDCRHLRSPFALWLRGKGWDDYALADAFGYPRAESLRYLVGKRVEEQSQVRAKEVIVLPSLPADEDSFDPDYLAPRVPDQSAGEAKSGQGAMPEALGEIWLGA